MTRQQSVAQYINEVEPSLASLERHWGSVRTRLKRRRQLKAASAMVGVFALAVVGWAVMPRARTLGAGEVLVAEASDERARVEGGSEVHAHPRTVVTAEAVGSDEVVMVVERGAASFEVTRKPSRQFIVKADTVEVRVVGTAFTVRRAGVMVEVDVSRGVVEVRDGEMVQRLEAGAQWRRPAAVEVVTPSGGAPLVAPLEQSPPVVDIERRRVRRRPPVATAPPREAQVTGAQAPTVAPPPTLAEAVAVKPEQTAGEAFDAAMKDRAKGSTQQAIRGFKQVCERWPQSAYAPMSAFEWGRLALDGLDDPRQAARAFERTLELADSSSLVEDALARLAEAYGRFDSASCRRVQADYTRRFPSGAHRRNIAKACPP